MIIGTSENRVIKVVQVESSIDINSFAKLLASVVTDGDSNAYINKIIKNRSKNEYGRRCENV